MSPLRELNPKPRDVQLLLAKTKQELRSFNNQLNETRKRAEENGVLESSAALVE